MENHLCEACQSYSWEEIKTAQRDDKELSVLLDWIENKIEPGNNLFAMSKAAKFYWMNKELLYWMNTKCYGKLWVMLKF